MKYFYLKLFILSGIALVSLSSTAPAFDINKDVDHPAKSEKKPDKHVESFEMVYVKGGCFDMGDKFGMGSQDEKPVHRVCLGDFYLGKYEITQKEWKQVMGSIPSGFKFCGKYCPVELVSWEDAHTFIMKLNKKTSIKYRLPTEAEWEFAASGGSRNKKWSGTSSTVDFDNYAWHKFNFGNKTINPVGLKQPNSLGIYDMSGNVWEWVFDWYDKSYYNYSTLKNPMGPQSGTYRVFRGGSWSNGPELLRTSYRSYGRPGYMDGSLGMRLARTP